MSSVFTNQPSEASRRSHVSMRSRKYPPQNFSRNAALNLLRRFEPMAGYDWHSLATLARHSNEVVVPADRLLIRPPRRLEGVWYLCAGSVRNEQTGERFVAGSRRCRSPLYPGQNSLRSISAVRLLYFEATAARLFRLHLDYCEGDNKQNSIDGDMAGGGIGCVSAGAVSGAATNSWLENLAASPVLRLLYRRRGASGWQRWLRELEPAVVAPAQQLIAPGVAGESFYVVQSGVAVVEKAEQEVGQGFGPDHEIGKATCVPPVKGRYALATVSAGGFFGEDSLLTGQPRNARVHMPLGGHVLRGGADQLRELVSDLWWALAREPASWTTGNEPLQFPMNQDVQALRQHIDGLEKTVAYGLCVGHDSERLDLALLLLVHRGYRVLLTP